MVTESHVAPFTYLLIASPQHERAAASRYFALLPTTRNELSRPMATWCSYQNRSPPLRVPAWRTTAPPLPGRQTRALQRCGTHKSPPLDQ